jgi:predicted RNA-binding Zn ribbon-like protein
MLPEPDTISLLEIAEADPESAAHVLKNAIDFREAIHRLFAAVADGGPANSPSLAMLNTILTRALAHRALTVVEDGYAWAWEGAWRPSMIPAPCSVGHEAARF